MIDIKDFLAKGVCTEETIFYNQYYSLSASS